MDNPLELTLERGQYLAPVYNTYENDGLLVGITEYNTPIETGIWHAHENPMISYVIHGGNVEHRKGKEIERTSGCTNFYHAFEPHQNIYKAFPSKHLSIEFEHAFLERYNLDEEDIYLATQKDGKAQFTFLKVLNEIVLNDTNSHSAISVLFLDYISSSTCIKETSKHPQWAKDIKALLHDRWNEHIPLHELADDVGVHPITISKHFRSFFGSTYGEYARKIKIEKAIQLMGCPNSSLTDIAFRCGFADQSHFTRVFKSLTGFKPKEYQRL